jgi:hypothetical protein
MTALGSMVHASVLGSCWAVVLFGCCWLGGGSVTAATAVATAAAAGGGGGGMTCFEQQIPCSPNVVQVGGGWGFTNNDQPQAPSCCLAKNSSKSE